jgi:hypothetical protein
MLKLKDMELGIRYKVLTDSIRINKGDSIIINEDQCTVLYYKGLRYNFLEEYEWSRLRNKVEIDMDYYTNKETRITKELDALRKLIRELEFKNSVGKAKKNN